MYMCRVAKIATLESADFFEGRQCTASRFDRI